MDKFFDTQLMLVCEMWREIKGSTEPSDRWLGNYFHHNRRKFGSRDRRFLSETIYALFRHKLLAECWQRECGFQKIEEALPIIAAACESLLSYEEFLEVLPRIKNPNITVDRMYKSLQKRELPEKVSFASDEEQLSVRHSFPLWLVKRWELRYGLKGCESLLESMQRRPPLTVRTNIIKISRPELARIFQSREYEIALTQNSDWGITFRERINLFDSQEFREGYFEVQDEGSQIISKKVAAAPGEVIWDLCAGGGGKSLAMAAMMQNKGRIIATDIRASKLEELKKRARRAGIFNIFPADMARLDETKEAKAGFDKILVDAPCSGTGTLRRNPDAKWKLTEEKFQSFKQEQIAIVRSAIGRLKKGGKLYYVTCSLEPDENEDVMREIFKEYPQLKPLPVNDRRGEADQEFLRLMPDRDQTDGFFLAVAENKG